MDAHVLDCIENLKTRKRKIFASYVTHEDVETYSALQREFHKGNIQDNPSFKKNYRRFYQLDYAGLTEDWKALYFRTFEKRRGFDIGRSSEVLSEVLTELSRVPNRRGLPTVQFSFATKMLHTLHPELPIYDSMVGRMLHIHSPKPGLSVSDRIAFRVENYDGLKSLYNELLARPDVLELIREFKTCFDAGHISSAKALDFLLWGLGKFFKKAE